MEITKYGPKGNALDRARAELDDFRRRQNAPAVAVTVSKPPAPAYHEERLFRCATHTAMRSRLILKLTSGTAEIVAVRSAVPADYIGEATAEPQEGVLSKRALALGLYRHCPHCASAGIVLCTRCGTLSCIGPDETTHHCPACRRIAPLTFGEIALGFVSPAARTYTTAPKENAAPARPRSSGQKLLPRSVRLLEFKGK
jgi:hypothetical protein